MLLSPVIAELRNTQAHLSSRTDAYSVEQVPVYELALEVAKEASETQHANCHPDADCSCEPTGLGMFLTRCSIAIESAKRNHGTEFCNSALHRIFWAVEDAITA